MVSFVHERSTARIGLQLGHSGRKGSTRLMWEGMDDPLPRDNCEVVGPSPLPYGPGSAVPRELTRTDMDRIAAVANRRTDAYGGPLENRLRFPLEVFDAVREAWPAERPMIVRISATDWVPDGNTEHDAVEIARAFIAHGADAIDVSSGQVTKDERPAFGRSYQTPFADRIRHEVAAATGAAVIAVGAIASYDDVNSLLLAGRADLCAVGRTHLYDPHWTLHAAAEQDYRGPGAAWPAQFGAGARKPPAARTDAVRPRLSLLRPDPADQAVHQRWTPTREPAHAS